MNKRNNSDRPDLKQLPEALHPENYLNKFFNQKNWELKNGTAFSKTGTLERKICNALSGEHGKRVFLNKVCKKLGAYNSKWTSRTRKVFS